MIVHPEAEADKKTINMLQRKIEEYRMYGVPLHEKQSETLHKVVSELYSKRHEIARHYRKRLACLREFLCPKCSKELWQHGENGECPQFCKECGREME